MRCRSPLGPVLYATFGLLTSVAPDRAHAEDRPLPTDGIDEKPPGALALPPRLEGPGGIDLLRSVSVQMDNRRADDGLEVTTSYGRPTADVLAASPETLIWNVMVKAFERPGPAHKELHWALAPASSSGHVRPWHEFWQPVVDPPGLLFRGATDVGISYVGLLRQSLVIVYATVGRGLPPEQRPSVIERAAKDGHDLAMRVVSAIRTAAPAVHPMHAAFAERVTVEHGSLDEGEESRLVVRLTPNASLADDAQVRLTVFVAGRGKILGASVGELRTAPLPLPEMPKGTILTGTRVRVFRLVEGGLLRLEEVRVTVGPRGTRVVQAL